MPVAGANRRVIIGRRRDLGKAPSSARGACKKPSRLRGFLFHAFGTGLSTAAAASSSTRLPCQCKTRADRADCRPPWAVRLNDRQQPPNPRRPIAEFTVQSTKEGRGSPADAARAIGFGPDSRLRARSVLESAFAILAIRARPTCGPAVSCSRLRLPGPIQEFRESKKGLCSSRIKDRFFFCG